MKYSLQLGVKRQFRPKNGLSSNWYKRTAATINQPGSSINAAQRNFMAESPTDV